MTRAYLLTILQFSFLVLSDRPRLRLSKLTVSVHLADFLFAPLHKMLARFSILSRTPPRRAREHNTRRLLLCSRTESNCHCRIRNPVSYPLNDESDRRFISEPEPRRHQVYEGVAMLALVNVFQEECADCIGINSFKRDYEMRREPAICLDGEHGGEFAIHIFKNRERGHAFKGVQVVAYHDALFNETEAMNRRLFGSVKSECYGCNYYQNGEEVITE